MTPRTDVCDTCENLRRKVVTSMTEADKVLACQQLTEHVHYAQKERDHYRAATVAAAGELDGFDASIIPRPCPPCSQPLTKVHYTFDFAQNVCLQQEARQVGPLYFKNPSKVQVFGVMNEAVPLQVNYLLDESDMIGANGKQSHGPNIVVSLLHHFFSQHGYGEKACILHADNCGGQNKNKTVLAYLPWRCILGLHERMNLRFMIAGHTRTGASEKGPYPAARDFEKTALEVNQLILSCHVRIELETVRFLAIRDFFGAQSFFLLESQYPTAPVEENPG
eukprot:scpid33362/ scgid28055/ 